MISTFLVGFWASHDAMTKLKSWDNQRG
jgi:hypothetical protein